MQINNQSSVQQRQSFGTIKVIPFNPWNAQIIESANILPRTIGLKNGKLVICSDDIYNNKAIAQLNGVKTESKEQASKYVQNFRNAFSAFAQKTDIEYAKKGIIV